MNIHICVWVTWFMQYTILTKYIISSHLNTKFIHSDFKIFQLLFNERCTFIYLYLSLITSFYLYRRMSLHLLVSRYFSSSSSAVKFPQTGWESSPFENIGLRVKWNILILFIWTRMYCFQIWVTPWYAKGDTNDPGGLRHSNSPWKLYSNSCDFCYALAFTREMNAALCFLDEKKKSVKWAVCCQRLLSNLSSLGSPSESLLTECQIAVLFLHTCPHTCLS